MLNSLLVKGVKHTLFSVHWKLRLAISSALSLALTLELLVLIHLWALASISVKGTLWVSDVNLLTITHVVASSLRVFHNQGVHSIFNNVHFTLEIDIELMSLAIWVHVVSSTLRSYTVVFSIIVLVESTLRINK